MEMEIENILSTINSVEAPNVDCTTVNIKLTVRESPETLDYLDIADGISNGLKDYKPKVEVIM